jgi:hypothetical protein
VRTRRSRGADRGAHSAPPWRVDAAADRQAQVVGGDTEIPRHRRGGAAPGEIGEEPQRPLGGASPSDPLEAFVEGALGTVGVLADEATDAKGQDDDEGAYHVDHLPPARAARRCRRVRDVGQSATACRPATFPLTSRSLGARPTPIGGWSPHHPAIFNPDQRGAVKGLLSWENAYVLRQSTNPGGGLLEGAS